MSGTRLDVRVVNWEIRDDRVEMSCVRCQVRDESCELSDWK